jgi:Protein of unknown function (DUF3500)
VVEARISQAAILPLPAGRGFFDPDTMNSRLRHTAWIAAIVCSLAALLPARAHIAADEMAAAAGKFLDALPPELRAKASFDWKADERMNWHFIPKDRKGLSLKEMSPDQRKLAHALLLTGLSTHGYNKATNIMSLEPVLFEMEGTERKFPRDAVLYYFSLFGKPEPKGTWGWRVEGHHFSANFTIVKGEFFASTPSFLGSNPAEIRQGARKGVRVLAAEEDIARALVKSLDDEQQKDAVIDTKAPDDILTAAKRKVTALEEKGIYAAKLTAAQRATLMKLIREYVERVRPELAKEDLRKIEAAGVDKVQFAWAGGLEKGVRHYYRVQGPTFLLEYDNTQNNANHIHAVWRDFNGDFGEDLLRKHLAETPH